jgi:hypothetical protein
MVTSTRFTSRVNFFSSLLVIPAFWIMFICPRDDRKGSGGARC